MKKLLFVLLGFSASSCYAAIGGGIGGQFIQVKTTLQSGATFYVSSGTVSNLNTNTIKFSDGSTQTTAASGGGGGSSTMQTKVNGVQISSPTKSLAFDSNFTGSESPTGTANISLNPGTTLYIQNTNSLQSGATIYVSSESVSGPLSVFRSNFQALLLPSTTVPFELINTTSHQLYMIFKTSGTEWWRLGSDVTGLGTPEYDVYNVTTGIKDIAISTNDVMNINATAAFPSLTASRPMKLNASKQVTSGLIDVTSDITGTVPDGNLPANLVHTNVSEVISSSHNITAQLSVNSLKFPDGTIQVTSAAASGSFIQNTSTLQTGTTFYVSSGAVANQLNLTDNNSVVPFTITRAGKQNGYFDFDDASGFVTSDRAVLFTHMRTGSVVPTFSIINSTQTSAYAADTSGDAYVRLIARNSSFEPAQVQVMGFAFTGGSNSLKYPDAANSGNYTILRASDTLSASTTFTLPSADSAGCMESDGHGTLSLGACNVGTDIVAAGVSGSNSGLFNFLGTTVTFAAPPIDTSDRVPILNNGAVSWPLAVTDGARLGSTQTFTGADTFTSTSGVNVTYGITGGSLTLTGLPGAGTLFADASGHISTTTAGGGSGDMILASTQTVSGAKTFTSSITASGYLVDANGSHGSSSGGINGIQVLTATSTKTGPIYQTFGVVVSTNGSTTTNAVTICQMTAAAGTQFQNWTLYAIQGSAASTTMTITVTYSDGTTTSVSTGASSNQWVFGNAGSLIRWSSSSGFIDVTSGSAKAVTGLKIDSNGGGTGSRGGTIAAEQVPL